MRRIAVALSMSIASLLVLPMGHAEAPHLLRSPSMSDTLIAFQYADDVWTVGREGGVARRLTSTGKVSDGRIFRRMGRRLRTRR
jgi:tricorn protease